jgi:alginate O-acetyltransferase complex protein AlgI
MALFPGSSTRNCRSPLFKGDEQDVDTASFQFILFGFAVAAISNFHHSPGWRLAVLLISSLAFVGMLAPDPLDLVPLAAFLLLGYVGLLMIVNGWSGLQPWLLATIVFTYIWLKKYTFLPHGMFLNFPYLTLGLSYIFFRVLHLLIEASDKGSAPTMSLGRYLAYTLNFTTFVSGPIQRYDDFAKDQFAQKPIGVTPRVAATQIERIIRGFFKVNVLALILNMFQSDALAQLTLPISMQQKFFPAVELATVYPFFLYANFSGYIDIVIAIARLLNIRLPENFDRPFSASSFLEFWSRWHITLSNWLKTYVYNPLLLALMRRNSAQALDPFLGVFCFFVTFFLVGVWHGRTSEFLVFGLLQGGGVATNKLWQITLTQWMGVKAYRRLTANPGYIAWGRGLTFSWFAFTLFWFWSNWDQIYKLFAALGALGWLAVWASIWLAAATMLSIWEWIRAQLVANQTTLAILTSRYTRVVFVTVILLLTFAVTTLMSQPAPDIIYKAF